MEPPLPGLIAPECWTLLSPPLRARPPEQVRTGSSVNPLVGAQLVLGVAGASISHNGSEIPPSRQHHMESEGFIFPICVYFIIKKKLRSNRGPERGGKGIHTYAPVKNRNKSFLVPSPEGPLHCLGLVIIWTTFLAAGKDKAGGWGCKGLGGRGERGMYVGVGGGSSDKRVAVAVTSQTPMEKQNKIKNSRQIAFAIKAKHLTYMNVGRKWMCYRALKNNDFSGEASCPYFRQCC